MAGFAHILPKIVLKQPSIFRVYISSVRRKQTITFYLMVIHHNIYFFKIQN